MKSLLFLIQIVFVKILQNNIRYYKMKRFCVEQRFSYKRAQPNGQRAPQVDNSRWQRNMCVIAKVGSAVNVARGPVAYLRFLFGRDNDCKNYALGSNKNTYNFYLIQKNHKTKSNLLRFLFANYYI